MNIVFFGTSGFAVAAMREILSSRHKVVMLVTQPDKKSGRSLKLSYGPTKALAVSRKIPVYQPEDASSPASVEYLKRVNPDLFCVVAFGQILKRELLSVPKLYSINLHASLLPKYRGAAPTNWAIISGDKVTGVTVIRMNEGLDEGDMILKKDLEIGEEDTNITLSEELAEFGAKVLLEAIDLISYGKAASAAQDSSQATYAPKLKKKDGLIDWGQSALKIRNKVRGFLPWPGAYTHFGGRILKVLKVEVSGAGCPGDAPAAGTIHDIVKDRGIIVHTGSGDIELKYIQLEGKKAMDADSFVRGHRMEKGYVFS